jgi:hypothetical protein
MSTRVRNLPNERLDKDLVGTELTPRRGFAYARRAFALLKSRRTRLIIGRAASLLLLRRPARAFEITMALQQAALKVALIVETVLIILVATAVIPLCLTALGVANCIEALVRSDRAPALPARES